MTPLEISRLSGADFPRRQRYLGDLYILYGLGALKGTPAKLKSQKSATDSQGGSE